MSMRNIIRISRGARKHPKRDMGTPPNQRGRKPYRPVRHGVRMKLGLALVLGFLFGPNVLDLISMAWRRSEGCRIWTVVDGDTLRMICPDQGNVSGRILGYDAPEITARCPQEFGKALAATYYLHWKLWTAREVVATPRGTDLYNRILVLLTLDGEGAGRVMVDAGLARWYDGGRRRGWCGAL